MTPACDVERRVWPIRLDFGTVRTVIDPAERVHPGPGEARGGYGGAVHRTHHIGLLAESRDELVEWERRFDALCVTYMPIRDMSSHPSELRDPDSIALELSASNEVMAGWLEELRTREMSQDEIKARVTEYLSLQA